MLLPYRVKNPPKRFPYATLTLIVLNVILYLCTTDGLSISEEMGKAWGFAWGKTPLYNMFTSMFLHGDPFHLFGNMLFLWIFGGPVEDRLGVGKYLAMYFLAGVSGAMLQVVLDFAVAGEGCYCIGASGAIMGVLGAYWYLFPWSTVCVFYFIWFGIRVWAGSFDLEAIWVILVYFAADLFKGIFFGSFGVDSSIAHFAHVGGVFGGLLFCYALRAKRDTEAMSRARASQADMKDISLLPLDALETMLEEDPTNPEVIRAFIPAAINMRKTEQIDEVMANAGPTLIDKDPDIVAYYLVMRLCDALVDGGALAPVAAAWLPNGLFLLGVGWSMLRRGRAP
jgi:membrane associated rhomboid family serine protease